MPSPFSRIKNKAYNPKPGTIGYDLQETQKDIRRAKRGEGTEASLEEMRETKKRLKKEFKDEIRSNEEAMKKDRLEAIRKKAEKERWTA